MKKEKTHKKSRFGFFLAVYAGSLAVVILIICILVWNGLSRYQKSHDKAKKSCNPDIYAEEFIDKLNYTKLTEYIDTYGLNVKGVLDYKQQHAEYFNELIKSENVTYKQNEKYRELLPVYDIYAGSNRIAVISLKSLGESDQFGYHKWQLKDLAFDTEKIDYKEVVIHVPSGEKVYFNGFLVNSDSIAGTDVMSDPVSLKAKEICKVSFSADTYVIKNVIETPQIQVMNIDGTELTDCYIDGTTYDYTKTATEDFKNSVSKRVLTTCEVYVKNVYNKASFSDISGYLEAGSDAYAVVKDIQPSLDWAWKPDTVQISDEKITDFVKYSNTLFSCRYHCNVHKADAKVTEDESNNYNLLFRKNGSEWYLTYFVIE